MAADRHRGFTLIEVLVAFSILSLTLAAVFALLSSGTRSTHISDEYSKAVVLAESKVAELGITEPLRPGTLRGRFDSSYQWELHVNKRVRKNVDPYADYPWDVLNVTLRVWWKSMGEERDITLSTLRLAGNE